MRARRGTRWVSIIAILAAAAMLSGCADILRIGPGMQNTITAQEAVRKVADYGMTTAAAFPASAWLERQSGDVINCGFPTDHGPLGRVTAGVSYWVRGLPQSEVPQQYDAFVQWLSRNDFVILFNDRSPTYGAFISGQSREDAFRVAFSHVPGVDPTVSVDSPCVWPNGTPEPKSP